MQVWYKTTAHLELHRALVHVHMGTVRGQNSKQRFSVGMRQGEYLFGRPIIA